MKRLAFRLSWIEVLVATGILLVLLRIFFAGAIREWETQLFEMLGINGAAKYLLLAPLGLFVFYRRLRPSIVAARATGRPVVRWQILALSGVALLGAVACAYLLTH